MKSGILTFCLFCFLLEDLCESDSCLSRQLCKNIEQSPVSDPQVKVEFHSGIFKFNFSYPKNVTGFSMTLLKGQERQKICALHMENGEPTSESNESYCQPEHSGDSMSFILKDLESKHTGIYICCLEILMPAPYIDCRVNETYLYIYDSEACFVSEMMSWMLIGITVFSMVSCICCIIACCLTKKTRQGESKSHEYNSEYMPMAAVNAARKPAF
ncbi:inducible T-cell costimulator [Emydura macquarii macquarii]|uniref:inducible T-cell costimulator n=1 Tax=Emydura macquarii macquarii TaxID=1129001 RepID=UPI00352A51C6